MSRHLFKGLDPKPVPPKGSRRVGMTDDEHDIWENEFPVAVIRKPKIVDGKEVWRRLPNGEPVTQVMVKTIVKQKRRFVVQPHRTGCCSLNFHFEPDPAEKQRIARQTRVREFQQRLAEAAVDQGLSVEQLVGAIVGKMAPAGDPAQAELDIVTEEAGEEDGGEEGVELLDPEADKPQASAKPKKKSAASERIARVRSTA